MSDKCGTYAGYSEHTKFKTEVCGPCRQAATDYNRERRRKTGQTTRTLVPLTETKRFTDAELAAEYWCAVAELAWHGTAPADRFLPIQRFVTTPSYDEVPE